MAEPPVIGLAGTFDVENLGDLLLPLIAETELTRRLGPLNVRRFSYAAKAPPEWPFAVTSVADLPEIVGTLDAMLIGGGHIVRFDKNIAPNYAPPSPDIHHPTGYWLMPALFAQQQGVPVVWNAVGAHGAVPAWAEPLLREAIADSAYVAVRDEASRDTLAPLANGKTIAVVPDTCFGVSRILDRASPSAECLKLRTALGLDGDYIVVQATSGLGAFARFVRDNRDRLDRYRLLSLPIGPALGDSDLKLTSDFEAIATLSHWPHPLVLAELIAGARAVVGSSMHLAITALSFGVPVFRPAKMGEGKYAVLAQHSSVHAFRDDDEIDADWFEGCLDQNGPDAKTRSKLHALEQYWDNVAHFITRRGERANGRSGAGPLSQQLPTILETRSRLADLQRRLDAQEEEISSLRARVDEIPALAARGVADREYIAALHRSTSWRVTAPLRWMKTRAARPTNSIIDFNVIASERLVREPFDWAFANGVFAPDDARRLVRTYPHDHFKTVKGYDGEKGYEYEARALIGLGQPTKAFAEHLSPWWRRLADDLLSGTYREAVSRLTGRDLMSAPMEAYVCHFGPGAWLGPHVDLREKIMTHVFYFNESWRASDGGCLAILGSKDISDQIAEVTPVVGNTSVLVRADNSWHAVSRVNGALTSRRSMNVIFYHPGAVSTMWPPGETPALHDYRQA